MNKKLDIVVVLFLALLCAVFGLSLIDHPMRAIGAPFIYGTDYASAMHMLETSRMMWQSSHRIVGYNPWFMAGYPFADYISGLIWKLLCVIFMPLNNGTITLIFLTGALGLFPIAGYLSARVLGRSQNESIVSSALAFLLAIFGQPMFLAWMGLLEAVVAAAMVLTATAFLFRYFDKGGVWNWSCLTIVTAFAILFHKTALSALCLISLQILIFRRPLLSRIGAAAGAGVVAIIANLFWILPIFKFRAYFEFAPHYFWGEKNGAGALRDFFSLDTNFGSLSFAWLLIVGSVGGWLISRRESKKNADGWLAAQIVIALFSYVGTRFDFLNPFQPRRFMIYCFVLAVVPTSVFLSRMFSFIEKRSSSKQNAKIYYAFFAAIIFLSPNAYRRIAPYKLMTALPIRAQAVVDWIKNNTTTDARVMIEEIGDSGRPDNPYGGSYLNEYLPTLTNREIIGGPYPGLDIIYHRVTFLDGEILKKPVARMTDDELARIFDLYNIGWVIGFSPEAVARFKQASNLLEEAAQYGPIHCFNVKREKSFFLIGEGTARANHASIELKITKLENGAVVIKYHWAPDLKATGGAKIERFPVDYDPVGFIRIVTNATGKVNIAAKNAKGQGGASAF